MTEADMIDTLKKEFGDSILEISEPKEHRIDVLIVEDKIIDVANYVKHEMGFTIPNMCTGIDYKDKMQVVWHVGSPEGPTLLVLKVNIDRDECTIESLTPIWEGMNWHERETYDLLGVNFQNHPDLRRLLMPENWEGHPLREDYVYRKPTYRKPEDFA